LKNMERILITGGGGYLGSKLAERLSEEDHELYLLDLSFNDLSQKISASHSSVNLVHCDLTQDTQVEKTLREIEPSVVFHFAALLTRERDFKNYERLYEVNVQGSLNLLRAMSKTEKPQRIVYSSSSEIYGSKNSSPFHENQVPDPASPYSLTKLMAENLIKTYCSINRLQYTIFRLFNFYGDGMPENFFISQLKHALDHNELFHMTNGEQVRDFLEINDLLALMLRAYQSEKSIGETINICSGTGVRLVDLATTETEKQGKAHLLKIGSLPYRENEVWEMVGSNDKIQSILQCK